MELEIIILGIAIIAFFLFRDEIKDLFRSDNLKNRRLYKVEREAPEQTSDKSSQYVNIYYKSSLLTKPEATFYNILKYKCDMNELTICPKVRLEDFIKVHDIREKQSYRGRIKSRHVDFLICDQYLNPLCGIELDDSSHNTWKARKADKFKNELYQAINLPLYRVRTGTNFESHINQIVSDIKESTR